MSTSKVNSAATIAKPRSVSRDSISYCINRSRPLLSVVVPPLRPASLAPQSAGLGLAGGIGLYICGETQNRTFVQPGGINCIGCRGPKVHDKLTESHDLRAVALAQKCRRRDPKISPQRHEDLHKQEHSERPSNRRDGNRRCTPINADETGQHPRASA